LTMVYVVFSTGFIKDLLLSEEMFTELLYEHKLM
jgi:hypothetical protein